MTNTLPGEDSRAHREALVAAAGDVRDLGALATTLALWLRDRFGAPVAVSQLRAPEGAGIANETWLFEAAVDGGTQRLVLRVKPSAVQLFPDPDFTGLFRLLELLRVNNLVRVPEVLWLEEDASILGAPFLVMRMLEGRVPITSPVYTAHGWVAEATADQRRTLWTTAVEELARIHLVPAELVAFIGWPRYGPTGEDQQLGYWEHYRQWSGAPLDDDMLELAEWIGDHRPHEPDLALSWGDARPGNMMFGDDFRVVGVMDWDEMSLAGPRHDLSWWLWFDELNTTYKGVARPAGLGSRQETIELWESLTGVSVGDLSWHDAFTAYKVALITLKMMHAAGYPPDKAAGAASFMVHLGRASAGLEGAGNG